MNIALAVIAGDDAFEQGFERMLKSVEGKVDGVFVSFNGENDDVFFKLSEAIDADVFSEGNVAEFPWQEDFSLARNHSFHLVWEHMRQNENVDFDWIVWLDCDDVVPEYTDFAKAAKIANERHAHGVWLPYHYKVDDNDHEIVLAQHYKERMLRIDVDWTWIYPIHENCTGPTATRFTKVDHHPVKHLRAGAENKRERNRKIIARWWRQEKDNPRAQLLMAHETFAAAEDAQSDEEMAELANAAMDLYKKFLAGEITDDSYAANLQVARLLMMLKRPNDAINIALQGIKMEPTWPGAYVCIAEIYHHTGNHQDAIEWAQITREACDFPETIGIFENLDLHYKPLMIEGASQMALSEYKKALHCFQEAHSILPDSYTKERINEAAEKFRATKDIPAFDVRAYRDVRWGSQPDKSIAFFCRPHYEEWDEKILERDGLGGTETCVIKLAQQFAADGWRSVIFGTPREERMSTSGVEWFNAERWHPDEPFTATVSVRTPQIFEANVKSLARITWMHDVNVGDVRFADGGDLFSPKNFDALVAPSPWHMKHLAKVYEFSSDSEIAELNVIFNGFEHDVFKPTGAARKLDKFIYASSPDRGLERLLEFWPDIKSFYKGAELHIFYGWEAVDRIINLELPTAPMLAYLKDKIEGMMDDLGREEGGIFWHGRVSQRTLAIHMRGSNSKEIPGAGFMLYPANFLETFGIVFAQAMTAGCIPLTCDLGNLPDLIGDRRCIVDGAAPGAEIYRDLFLPKLYDLMTMPNSDLIKLRGDLSHRVAGCTWRNITDQWQSLIERIVDRKTLELQVVQG